MKRPDPTKHIRVGREQAGVHHRIEHKDHVYARGDVTANNVESSFALLMRGLHGIYHSVSKKHMHRYLAETCFRYSHRTLEDGQRVVRLIQNAGGKRLAYADQLGRNPA